MRRPRIYFDELRQVSIWADPACEQPVQSLIAGETEKLYVKNESDKYLMFIPSFELADVEITKVPSILWPQAIRELEFTLPGDAGDAGVLEVGFQIEEIYKNTSNAALGPKQELTIKN